MNGILYKNKYFVAFCLAALSAVLAVPYFLAYDSISDGRILFSCMAILMMTAISVSIIVIFKNLLNERSQFHKADLIINVLIFLEVALALFSLLEGSRFLSAEVEKLYYVAFLVYGAANLIFGVLLLLSRDKLYGMLYPLATLAIMSGLVVLVEKFMLLGLIAAILSNVFLAVIFYRYSREWKPVVNDLD